MAALKHAVLLRRQAAQQMLGRSGSEVATSVRWSAAEARMHAAEGGRPTPSTPSWSASRRRPGERGLTRPGAG